MKKTRIGFRGSRQLPLMQVWREIWSGDDVKFAYVIWQWYPRWLQRRDGIPQA